MRFPELDEMRGAGHETGHLWWGQLLYPELIDGLIQQYESLPVSELCLTDINESRLGILGGLSPAHVGQGWACLSG